MDRNIVVSPTPVELARTAADLLVEAAAEAIAATGRFSLGLAGGSTPQALYELLTTDAYHDRMDWGKLEIFFGDERCVGPADKQSNYRMAREAMLDHVNIPPENVHRMMGELDPQIAAKQYDALLHERFRDGGLDVVLLGMGDDGHTASLFPETDALGETSRWAVANHVPKLDAWRITMTAPFINRAAQVIFLVAGEAKARRLEEVLEGPQDPQRLPIQLIAPAPGRATWLLDIAAAGMATDD